ncbi:MAG: hypothetical protein ACRDZW_00600 [Acidimicrobiales bacterium]
MFRSSIERKLTACTARLNRARADLAVLDEQRVFFNDDADDARVRALVSDSPMAGHDHRDAQRHADAMARSRVALVATIADLEQTVDTLLDRLAPSRS